MRSGSKLYCTLLSTLLLAACASGGFRDRQEADLALYLRHAGEPVEQIRTINRVDRWRSLAPDKLVVWTSVNRAWLFTLRAPCTGLEFTQTIGISSTNNVIDRRFDRIFFERQQCFIAEIRPIDHAALRKEQRAAASVRGS